MHPDLGPRLLIRISSSVGCLEYQIPGWPITAGMHDTTFPVTNRESFLAYTYSFLPPFPPLCCVPLSPSSHSIRKQSWLPKTGTCTSRAATMRANTTKRIPVLILYLSSKKSPRTRDILTSHGDHGPSCLYAALRMNPLPSCTSSISDVHVESCLRYLLSSQQVPSCPSSSVSSASLRLLVGSFRYIPQVLLNDTTDNL